MIVIKDHIDGLVRERCDSIANALELCLSCTKPSIFFLNTLEDCIYAILPSIENCYSSLANIQTAISCCVWIMYSENKTIWIIAAHWEYDISINDYRHLYTYLDLMSMIHIIIINNLILIWLVNAVEYNMILSTAWQWDVNYWPYLGVIRGSLHVSNWHLLGVIWREWLTLTAMLC